MNVLKKLLLITGLVLQFASIGKASFSSKAEYDAWVDKAFDIAPEMCVEPPEGPKLTVDVETDTGGDGKAYAQVFLTSDQPQDILCGLGGEECETKLSVDNVALTHRIEGQDYIIKAWEGCTSTGSNGEFCYVDNITESVDVKLVLKRRPVSNCRLPDIYNVVLRVVDGGNIPTDGSRFYIKRPYTISLDGSGAHGRINRQNGFEQKHSVEISRWVRGPGMFSDYVAHSLTGSTRIGATYHLYDASTYSIGASSSFDENGGNFIRSSDESRWRIDGDAFDMSGTLTLNVQDSGAYTVSHTGTISVQARYSSGAVETLTTPDNSSGSGSFVGPFCEEYDMISLGGDGYTNIDATVNGSSVSISTEQARPTSVF